MVKSELTPATETAITRFLPPLSSLSVPQHLPDTVKTRLAMFIQAALKTGIPIPGLGLLVKHQFLPSLASSSDDEVAAELEGLLPYFYWVLDGNEVVEPESEPEDGDGALPAGE